MSEWFDSIKEWFHEGSCTNRSDKDMFVCVGDSHEPHHVEVLKPGERTKEGKDCDGVIRRDGGVDKVYGRSGWMMEKDRTWLEKNWPGCANVVQDFRALEPKIGGIRITKGDLLPTRHFVHCQGLADSETVAGGWFAGTRGQALRLEGFQLESLGEGPSAVELEYMAHLEGTGDTPWQTGGFIGTRGEARRLEGFAIRVKSTGGVRANILYKAHLQDFGDTEWYADGVFCGSRGQARRVEGISIALVAGGIGGGQYARVRRDGPGVVAPHAPPDPADPALAGIRFVRI